MSEKGIPDIKVCTIKMQIPVIDENGKLRRVPNNENEFVLKLIEYESKLRRFAYRNTTINTGESFFDDSDMISSYFLVVVYDTALSEPLLTSRYFFDKALIKKNLRGESEVPPSFIYEGKEFDPNNFQDGEIFLADRLSGNIRNSVYRNHRKKIFSMYYDEVVRQNQKRHLLLMVRKEGQEKQIERYIEMGFVTIGTSLHKGKEHTVILGDLQKYKEC